MQEERTKVLELVAEGRISVEDADELLAALEDRHRAEEAESLREVPRPRPSEGASTDRPGPAGARKLSFDQLVQLGIHGIEPEFVKRVRARFPDLSFDRLLDLGLHGVDLDYLEQMQDVLPEVDIDELIGMARHGVEPEYAREIRRLAPDLRLTADQLTELTIHGIDVSLVDALAEDISDLASSIADVAAVRSSDVVRRVVTPPRPPRPPRPARRSPQGDVDDLPDPSGE